MPLENQRYAMELSYPNHLDPAHFVCLVANIAAVLIAQLRMHESCRSTLKTQK